MLKNKIKIIISTLLILLSINLSFAIGMMENHNSNDEHNYEVQNYENNMMTDNSDSFFSNFRNNFSNFWSNLFSNNNNNIEKNNFENHFIEMEKEMKEHQNESMDEMMDEHMKFDKYYKGGMMR